MAEKKLEIGRLETAWKQAAWRAQNPGEAPYGPVTFAEMTDGERQGLTMALMLAAGQAKPEPARPSPGEALRDASRWRAIRGTGSMVVIPPAASSGGRS